MVPLPLLVLVLVLVPLLVLLSVPATLDPLYFFPWPRVCPAGCGGAGGLGGVSWNPLLLLPGSAVPGVTVLHFHAAGC